MGRLIAYIDILMPWVAGGVCLALHLAGYMSTETLSVCLSLCWGASDAREGITRRQGGA
jgi:hypothetical protein